MPRPKTKKEETVGAETLKSPRQELFTRANGDNSSNNFSGIHWRDLIDKKHLYINVDYYTKREAEPPSNADEAPDEAIIVRLSGLKELAIAHGFTTIYYNNLFTDSNSVTLSCQISWERTRYNNFNMVITEGVASATEENVGAGSKKYLATIASNRAFARAVRDYFGIFSVTDEELDKSDIEKQSMEETQQLSKASVNAIIQLKNTVQKKLKIDSFPEFRDTYLLENKEELSLSDDFLSWTDFNELSIELCRKINGFINKRIKKKK